MMKMMNNMNNINDMMLEKVAGGSVWEGALKEDDARFLLTLICEYKTNRWPLDTLLKDMLREGYSNESMWFVGTHWYY